jgi:hypothetical protein
MATSAFFKEVGMSAPTPPMEAHLHRLWRDGDAHVPLLNTEWSHLNSLDQDALSHPLKGDRDANLIRRAWVWIICLLYFDTDNP